MSYILAKDAGMYDNTRRFAFTNITDEVFVSHWGGQPITVKPHQTVELVHHLADKLTNELVDKIMMNDIKMDEVKNGMGKEYYRSPRGMSLGVPAARKPWEEKIVRELQVDEESPELVMIKQQIKEEVLADIARSSEKTADMTVVPADPKEFSDVNKLKEAPKEKAPIKVKEVKVK